MLCHQIQWLYSCALTKFCISIKFYNNNNNLNMVTPTQPIIAEYFTVLYPIVLCSIPLVSTMYSTTQHSSWVCHILRRLENEHSWFMEFSVSADTQNIVNHECSFSNPY